MPTKKVITTEEEKKEAPKDEYVYARDHKKRMREIAIEERTKPIIEEKEEKKDEKVVTPSDEEGTKEKESDKEEERKAEELAKQAKEKRELEEREEKRREEARQIAEEAARKATEAARKDFQDKIDAITAKEKTALEKQKEADELVASWEKENRLPKDWREIAKESLRISDARFEQKLKEREEADKKAREEQRQQEEKSREEDIKAQQARVDDISKKVVSELNELYEAKYLTKPADLSNVDAEDMKETNELVKFGIELNRERAEKKLLPIDSISKIYFMHYKPFKDAQGKKDDQPPGADAPVSGAKAATVRQETSGYDYAKDHGKSYRQILIEALQKAKQS